jgi:ribosomal protein L16 Arg81 hydroxylase
VKIEAKPEISNTFSIGSLTPGRISILPELANHFAARRRGQTRADEKSDIREIEQNVSLAAMENLRYSFHEHLHTFNINLATQS